METEGWYFKGFNQPADINFRHNCSLSFSIAVQTSFTSRLERFSGQLTRLMSSIRYGMAIDVT